MGLAIIYRGGKSGSVLTCDECGERIENLELAIARFGQAPDGATSDVYIYHKVRCDPGGDYWLPLRQYFPWLMWNNRWGLKEYTEKGFTLTIEVPEPLEM